MKSLTWARFVACAVIVVAPGCKGNEGPAATKTNVAPSASAAPAPETARLVRSPAVVGEKRRMVRKGELTLGVEFWQEGEKLGTQDSARSEEYDRTSEVLGLVGGAPAKEKVHYDRYRLHEAPAGKPAVDDSSVEGKSYVLDATDGKLRAEGEGKKAVSPPEVDRLRKLHGDLGKDDPIVAAIGDAPFTVGSPLSMRVELLHALVTSESGQLKSGRIWLDAIREENGRRVALFKWTADTKSQEDNGLTIDWHMSGTVTVGVSPAVTLGTTMNASLDASGETTQRGGRVTMAGAGTMKDQMTLTVTRP